MLDVLCVGEALWDLSAPKGVTFERAASLRLTPGGAAVNVALHLAKLRQKVGLCSVVGADALGQALVAKVAAGGVDTSRVESAPERTGLVFVERAGEGRRIVGYRSADEQSPGAPEEIGAKILFLTGLYPSLSHLRDLREMAQRGREQGALVVLDLNARPRLWAGRTVSGIDGLFHDADLIRCSTDDLSVLKLETEGLRAWMRPASTLIVSDGPSPTRAFGPFGLLEQPPRALRVVDPTGAGDALSAGILAELGRAGEADCQSADFWGRAVDRGHALARAHLLRRGRR